MYLGEFLYFFACQFFKRVSFALNFYLIYREINKNIVLIKHMNIRWCRWWIRNAVGV